MEAVFCLVLLCLAQTFAVPSQPKDVNPFVEKNVQYYLYTREDTTAFKITKDDATLLKSSTFDPSKKTKVLIHGFKNDHTGGMEKDISDAYVKNQDVNVVVVDWGKIAAKLYSVVIGYVEPVGEEVAQMIDFLVSAGGADISDIHIVGHSLGAHVAGYAANYVTSGRITRITGLDPALPGFERSPPAGRLDADDADIVDCIHTCGGKYGFYEPICDYDFYPNGGVPVQPGCGFDWLGTCSHGRANDFFASSIAGNTFSAQSCATFEEVERGSCKGAWTGLLGELAPTTPAGLYTLTTTGTAPFAKK